MDKKRDFPLGNVKLTSTPRIRLKSATDRTREMAKIYRLFRHGTLDDRTAKTCAHLLKTLTEMVRDSDIETRLAELEEAVNER